MSDSLQTNGSVTNWLRAIETGNDDAAHRIWDRYSEEIRKVARRRMRRLKRQDIVDEDDIVISAYAALCLAARKGQLAKVLNREDLWGLMVVATLQKIGQRTQYLKADKRSMDLVADNAEVLDEFGSRLERIVCDAHGPESEAIHAERTERLLAKLDDPELRAVAILKIAGHTNDEIAVEMGLTRRTIQRMLNLIRLCWDQHWSGSS